MNRKFAQRKAAEARAMAALSQCNGWVCAKEVAKKLGWPWRVVARALRRAALMGEIESREELYERDRKRMDPRWLYRAKANVTFPDWLEPKVEVQVEVRGRVVRFD